MEITRLPEQAKARWPEGVVGVCLDTARAV